MNRKVLSVIVPAYNASRYIGPCLESLANQADENLEVVLVDDGSTDDTIAICESFNADNPNLCLKVIRKENGGPLSARLCGISHASGEFITFVDSDDILLEGSVGLILRAIREFDPDVVLFGSTRKEAHPLPDPFAGIHEVRKQDCLLRLCSSPGSNSLWGKVVRKKCFPLYDLDTFPFMSMGEDLFQVIDIFDRSNIFVEIDSELYYYRKNPEGLTAKFDSRYLESVSLAYEKLQEHAKVWDGSFGSQYSIFARGVWLQQMLSIARCAASALSFEETSNFFDLLSKDKYYCDLSDRETVLRCAAPYRFARLLINGRHYASARMYLRFLTRVMNAVL